MSISVDAFDCNHAKVVGLPRDLAAQVWCHVKPAPFIGQSRKSIICDDVARLSRTDGDLPTPHHVEQLRAIH